MEREEKRFFYGWVIVAVCFLTVFLGLGTRISFGVFYGAILKEFGWGRGETAGAFSIAMIVHALFAPVSGTLIDRFSPRKLFPMGAIFLCLGLLGASRINEIWHLYLFFGVIMAVGINSIGFGPNMALIPRWFVKKRGMASGIAISGFGFGALVVSPMTEVFIETIGWRSAFLVLGAIIVCTVVPLTAIFQRGSPAEVGQYPDNIYPDREKESSPDSKKSGVKDKSLPGEVVNWTCRAAVRTRAFWWIALTAFCHGFFVNMMLVHQTVNIIDAGYSQFLAASILGFVGLLASIGGIFFGFISDRIGKRVAICMGALTSFIGVSHLILLHYVNSPWVLYVFVLLAGLGQGSFSPVYVSTMGDLFYGNSLGRIISTLSMGYGIGGAIGSYIAGYSYDTMGSYLIPFLMVLVVICLGALGICKAAPRK